MNITLLYILSNNLINNNKSKDIIYNILYK